MGKGSSTVSGYRYYMGLHFGLCHSLEPYVGATVADGLLEVRAGDLTAWAGTQTGSGTIYINSPGLFGGDQREGGILGYADLMAGESTQLANPYLTAQQGLPQSAFRGLATLVYKSGQVGSNNPYPKPWTFRVRRTTAGWQGGAPWNPTQAAITLSSGVVGMNPAHIIYEALTNSDWGMGYPSAQLDLTSFAAAATQLYSEGLGLCVLWNRENTIEQFIQDIINNAGGALISDPTTGLFVLKLLRGGYNPLTLPTFTEDNVLEIVSYDAATVIGAINEMVVTYVDPTIGSSNYGGQQCVAVQATGSIQASGVVVSQKKDYKYLATADLASRIAQRDLAPLSTALKRIQVKLDRTAWTLTPADVFVLDFAPLGIGSVVFRVGEIDYGTLTAGAVTVTAIQDVFSLPASSYVAVPTTGWVPPNPNPIATTHWMGIDADYRTLYRDLPAYEFTTLGAGQGFIMLAAQRPTGMSYNYQLWSVVSPGSTYLFHGGGNWTPTALVTSSLGPFDTSISLNTPTDLTNVLAGTAAMLTDGVHFEVVEIDAIDPVALTATIARGCLDTVSYAFSAGARLWFVDLVFFGNDAIEYASGETVDVRPLTVTARGVLSMVSAPTVPIAIIGRQWLPYPPAYLTINGTRWDLVTSTVSGLFTVAWRERNRVTQADQLVDQTEATVTPESGTTYTLKIYDNTTNTLLQTFSGLTATSQTVTVGSGTSVVRVELSSMRGGYASWQKQTVTFNYSNASTDLDTEAGPALDTETAVDLFTE